MPSREFSSRAEQARIADGGRDRAGAHNADAWNGCQQFADPIAPMPFGQFRLDLPDFGLRIIQLRHDEPENRPRKFRQCEIIGINRRDQLFDVAQPPRRDDAEPGQMRAQRIDQHDALTNQKVTCPMQHRHRLLSDVLDRHETH
jgi:hypothetical protein